MGSSSGWRCLSHPHLVKLGGEIGVICNRFDQIIGYYWTRPVLGSIALMGPIPGFWSITVQ